MLDSKDGKGPAECILVDYKYRDPKDPTKTKDCHKSCGKKCKDSGENGCIDECEKGRFPLPKD